MLKPVEVEERVFRAAGAAALSGFAAVEAQAFVFREIWLWLAATAFWWPCKNLV